MTPASWSDEQISAFLDGELNQVDADALARAVESDTALAARVERLESATRAYVLAVSEIDRHPMPGAVEAILAAPPAGRVIPFRAKAIGAFVSEHRAIAASLICLAVAWGAYFGPLGQSKTDPAEFGAGGVLLASSPLHRALENDESSTVVHVAANETVTPRLTFASSDGGFCRQFDVSSPSGTTSSIACREDGKWRAQVTVFGKAGANGDYQTASGNKSPALEVFIDRHISGAPLSAIEERRLLSHGWVSAGR